MTLIIGLETDQGVYMIGDSCSSDGTVVRKTGLNKVFRCGAYNEFLIGYTYSFRMGQILQFHFAPEPQKEVHDDLYYLVGIVVPEIRQVFSEQGFLQKNNERESGGKFMIAYHGRLYTVDSDFQVNPHTDGYDVIGAGEHFALGAMKMASLMYPDFQTSEKMTKEYIRNRLLPLAMDVGEYFSPYVIGPYRWEFQPKETRNGR